MNDRTWSSLLKAGGIAALLSAILFWRNIGAEVSLFTGVDAIPTSRTEKNREARAQSSGRLQPL